MPNTKNNKSKKNAKRSQKKARGSSGLYVCPFPAITTKTVRYVEQVNLVESAAGAGAFYYWSPSSLYDPNTTGTGHQPMYFDQLCTSTGPYQKYRALSTRARLSMVSNSSYPILVGWFVSPSATTPASIPALLEKPWTSHAQLTSNAAGPSKKDWVISINHAKAMGITKQHLHNDEYYAGSYNGSPTNNVFLGAFVVSNAGLVGSTYVVIELDITAQFYSYGNQGSS